MPQVTDSLGNSYTTTTPASIEKFDSAVEAYLASRTTVIPLLDEILTEEPDFSMAISFRTYMLKLAADPKFRVPIKQLVEKLKGLKSSQNQREQMHISALEALTSDQMSQAVAILEQLLAIYPRDVLALRIAHYLHFYIGTDADMHDSIANAFRVWQPEDPYYGFILGMYSFGCEESGQYQLAEQQGRKAIEINPEDIWAAHSVTHVFQMQSRFNEGIEWVGNLLPGWQQANNFKNHLHWHKALCHIGANQLDEALAIYDDWLDKPISDDFYLDVCNAAALLWRLEMLGMELGDRWESQRAISHRRATDDDLVFPTLHYLMAPLKLNDIQAVEAAVASLEHWARVDSTQGKVCQDVGLPIARAMIDIRQGNTAQGAATMKAIADNIRLIGGSHAQRDLFTLIQNHYQ